MRTQTLLATTIALLVFSPSARAAEAIKAIDRFPARLDAPPALDLRRTSLPAPLAETFDLHSCPGATKVIYLDFNGHSGFEGDYAPFNFEGTPDTFSEAELATIQLSWHSVSEDFLPFEVDVTTEDPGVEALRNTGGSDTEWGIRCVVSASNWDYSWAYVGSFNWDTDYESQVYPGDNSWIWIADSASHEVGHSLYLAHDGGGGDGEYYAGHGAGATYWSPIMGWTGWTGVSQWSKGEYGGADNQEDDLEIITTQNGFGYRDDDHGSTTVSATPITLGAGEFLLVAEGIIERTEDLDFFAFTLPVAGHLRFRIEPDSLNANLDILAKLYDAGGAVLDRSNPPDSLHAEFDLHLAAGDYFLSVDGTGFGNPPADGYTDYACLGYFSVKARVCDLEVTLSNYPPSIGLGETLSFRADVTNRCDAPLTFDQALLNITGPASRQQVLYDGAPFTVETSVGTDLSLGVPPVAPVGTYAVEVTTYRDAEIIDADAFEVEVIE